MHSHYVCAVKNYFLISHLNPPPSYLHLLHIPSWSQEHLPHKEGPKPVPPHPYVKGCRGVWGCVFLTSLHVHQPVRKGAAKGGGRRGTPPFPQSLCRSPGAKSPNTSTLRQTAATNPLQTPRGAHQPPRGNPQPPQGSPQNGGAGGREGRAWSGGARGGSHGRWEVSVAKDAEGGKEKGEKK